MKAVKRFRGSAEHALGVTETHMDPERGSGPSPDGLVEPGSDSMKAVAPLQGQPARAKGGNWGPSPKRWH